MFILQRKIRLFLTVLFAVTGDGKQKFAPASDFKYIKSDGIVKISGYTGAGGAVNIPRTLDGLPVTSIGENAFRYGTSLTSITVETTTPPTLCDDEAFDFQGTVPKIAIRLLSFRPY